LDGRQANSFGPLFLALVIAMRKRVSLHRLLTSSVLSIGLFTGAVGLAYAYWHAKESLRDTIGLNFQELARQSADKVELVLARRLGWILACLLAFTGLWWGGRDTVWAKDRASASNVAFQQIVELESIARLLAILLDSGRSVINEHLPSLDGESRPHAMPAELFERQLAEMFLSRSGTDLGDLEHARIPARSKHLLKELVAVSKEVVSEARADRLHGSPGEKELIPAVFGARAAARFSERTGVRLKQTALLPRNPANAPDSSERLALEAFADSNYPREKVISEVTAKSDSLRLMYPLYSTRNCLVCHGEPKGERDQMGYIREGLKLGQNAGAISVIIPLEP